MTSKETDTAKMGNGEDMAGVYDKASKDFHNRAPELMTYKYIVGPAIVRCMDKYLPDQRDQLKVIDIGSASGRNVRKLIENGFSEPNFVGIEISPEQVDIAKSEFPKATFEVGDISDHPLERDRNDVAIMVMVPEFLDEDKYPKALENIYSSMKTGGTFIYVTTHPDRYKAKYGIAEGKVSTSGPWSERGNDELAKEEDQFYNWVRPVAAQKKALEDAGFEVRETEELKIPDSVDDGDTERLRKFKYPESYARLVFVAQKSTDAK